MIHVYSVIWPENVFTVTDSIHEVQAKDNVVHCHHTMTDVGDSSLQALLFKQI